MRNLLVVILLLGAWNAKAEEFTSGEQRATLLELYTSEGCSSCPPADRWYSTLKESPRLWKDLIPVAFHVDYWNYLGWDDRFSSPAYSLRQRQFKSEGAARAVYTPGMMALGLEWRGWRYRAGEPPRSEERSGVLSLKLAEETLEAVYEASGTPAEDLELHVAILGFGLKTPVKAGENRGEFLEHDFVVLAYDQRRGSGMWKMELPEAMHANQASRLALAAWVSPRGSVHPLQSVGGWLDGE